MAKSADAFRTISEVADWLETPAHVLRFWESKFSQVKPVKRAGGRRYYRPADMQLLSGIKKLLHDDGMTIKGVQKILREQGVRHVTALSQPLEGEAHDIEEARLEIAPETPPESAQVLNFRDGQASAAGADDDDAPDAPPASAPPAPAPETPAEAPTDMSDTPAPDTVAHECDESVTDTDSTFTTDTADAATEDAPEAAGAPPLDADALHPPTADDVFGTSNDDIAADAEPGPIDETEAPPTAPRPAIVTVPDDPPDNTPAPAGLLTQLSRFSGSLAPEQRARLASLCDRLHSASDKGGPQRSR
ncbi:DNA-binding transcriptional MerR regulator [Roseovarius halotolerans]|uniref:HTH merR-type domain-containing protein n=1 Tax=Roseovarius halotolerans TaxID=505353 RepID=A0A1X6YQA5_9RHOB|nr:MerR family transcriptional regulator [Roseovarius halotolerans]RKT34068.1 DNA-binding transcriptional MerR regulator [Roseovarius halotolerans]SLN27487.1 hypothetical protein ROH8110_01323 [Roseovarius halotolerans]